MNRSVTRRVFLNRAAGLAAAIGLAPLFLLAAPQRDTSGRIGAPQGATRSLSNPICLNGADPWIAYKDGFYYLTCTRGNRVSIRKAASLADMRDAPEVTVWHGGGPGYETFTRDVWAPELHFLNGKWYIYYAATDGPDADRRVFALESKTSDPLGEYTFKGKLVPPGTDDYAIDATVYQRPKDGAIFLLWSGHEAGRKGQNIYIAPMSNPYTISGPKVRLSSPDFDWEKHGWWVNEGPEVLSHGDKTFVFYSASGGTTANYCLGMLTNTDGNLLRAESWTKSPQPVFAKYSGPDGNVYTPGHNGFFQSPDGKEDWIVYHGKDVADNTWGGRSTRVQRFTWTKDGLPDLGHPIPLGTSVPLPSGDPGPKVNNAALVPAGITR